MDAVRPSALPTFNLGPGIDEILTNCLSETGLPAPIRPSW